MSLSDLVVTFLKKDDKPNQEIKASPFTSTRLWLTVGVIAGLIWLSGGILTEHNMMLAALVVIAYIAGNSLTKAAQIWVNGNIRIKMMELAWKDGKLTKEESDAIDKADK
jgi:hypothetical protein